MSLLIELRIFDSNCLHPYSIFIEYYIYLKCRTSCVLIIHYNKKYESIINGIVLNIFAV